MRLVLIVNPRASSVSPRRRERVERRLRRGADVTVVETTRSGDATVLARDAVAARVDAVAVLGGDGTLNEAAHGLAGTEIPLGCLPGGSTNVFARTLGIAYGQERAAEQLMQAFERASTRRVGLGRVGDRFFLFHLGVGFDAAVVRAVERRPAVKRYLAHPAFAAAATATWIRGYDRSTRLCVEITGRDDRRATSGPGPFVIVSNSRPYTYLGRLPMTLAPQADLDRGLALTHFRSLGLFRVLATIGSSLRGNERLARAPGLCQHADIAALTVRGDRPFPYQVDGEYLGETQQLEVHYAPEMLTVAIP